MLANSLFSSSTRLLRASARPRSAASAASALPPARLMHRYGCDAHDCLVQHIRSGALVVRASLCRRRSPSAASARETAASARASAVQAVFVGSIGAGFGSGETGLEAVNYGL